MLAYANNFDQLKVMSVLRLTPLDNPPDAPTPKAPVRYFNETLGLGPMLYPSSDLPVKAAQLQFAKLWKTQNGLVDIKLMAAPLLAIWLMAMGLIAWQIGRISRWHSTAFCAWFLLVADPVNLLYLNTLYAEFSAFAAFSIFTGLCWLALARQRISRSLVFAALTAMLMLATSRKQYMYLPLAFLLLLFLHPSNIRKAPIKAHTAVYLYASITIVIPIVLYNSIGQQIQIFNSWVTKYGHNEKDAVYRKYEHSHLLLDQVNRVNTVFAAMLPAASDPAHTLRLLKLPPDCLQFSCHNWFDTPATQYKEQCPAISHLSLPRLLPALLADPTMLTRMAVQAVDGHRGYFGEQLLENRPGSFIPWHLGHVEGASKKHVDDFSSVWILSLDSALAIMPREIRRIIILTPLFLPVLLAAMLTWRGRKHEAFALVSVQILALYFFFSSLLGDGYTDFERHAVLYPSVGALLLLAVPGTLWCVCTHRPG